MEIYVAVTHQRLQVLPLLRGWRCFKLRQVWDVVLSLGFAYMQAYTAQGELIGLTRLSIHSLRQARSSTRALEGVLYPVATAG